MHVYQIRILLAKRKQSQRLCSCSVRIFFFFGICNQWKCSQLEIQLLNNYKWDQKKGILDWTMTLEVIFKHLWGAFLPTPNFCIRMMVLMCASPPIKRFSYTYVHLCSYHRPHSPRVGSWYLGTSVKPFEYPFIGNPLLCPGNARRLCDQQTTDCDFHAILIRKSNTCLKQLWLVVRLWQSLHTNRIACILLYYYVCLLNFKSKSHNLYGWY